MALCRAHSCSKAADVAKCYY